jgi:hypothetical protein
VETVEVNGNKSMTRVLGMCDPRRKMSTEEEFVTFWSETREAFADFSDTHIKPKANPATQT